ncbi:MAG: DUF6427 family protein [Chitinophagaceae bacterium]|nr:DUF6427 family protein [Chitinophagaceae bacterium]
MIGFFKERNSFQFPAFLLLFLALKAMFIGAAPPAGGFHDPGGLLVPALNQRLLPSLAPGFITALSLLLQVGVALYANATLNNRRMFAQRHALAATSFILFTALFPGTNLQLPVLLVLPLFVAAFSQVTLLYNSSQVRGTIVNAGMLAGLGYLLYHPFVFVLPACFIGLSYMRPFRLADWLLMLLGMLTPLYFVLAGEFITGHWLPARHLPRFVLPDDIQAPNAYWWMAMAAALVWLIAAIGAWQGQLRRMVIQGRKNWYTLLMMGLFCLPGIFIPEGNHYGMLALMAFPLGGLLASAFSSDRKGVGQLVLFWLVVIIIATVSWGWLQGAMQ